MTPMIDVVFLLLIFFVWTASFRIAEYSLPTNLNVAAGESKTSENLPEIDYDQIVIRITGPNGALITLNDSEVTGIDELATRLNLIANAKADLDVIVHPENEVSMGTVIDVFDVAKIAGFEKVQFAAPLAVPQ